MSGMDIGESLVGSYMRYIRRCEVVVYNTFLQGRQGELDVIAVKTEPRAVYFCEVTTHIGGLLIVGPDRKDATIERLRNKLTRAIEFADITFPGDEHRFEIWSPRVPVGKTTEAFTGMRDELADGGRSLEFVINEDYTERVRELIEHARGNMSATSEPAYRMLQIMTHLRGAPVGL